MNRPLPLGLTAQHLSQLAAGVLLAATLAAGSIAAHPQRAAADGYDFAAPTLVSVDRSDPATAEVSLRNHTGGESGFNVYAYLMPAHTFARAVERTRGVPGQERTITITVDGLDPSAGYCFTAFALNYGSLTPIDGSVYYNDSPASNEVCANPPASAPQAPAMTLHPGRIPASGACLACILSADPSTTSIPVLPDLAITRISGDQQPTQGFSSVYEVVLANLGAKPQSQVQVQISVTGSLRYLQMTQTPAGFTCTDSGSGSVTCVGPLGGYGDAPITTFADFQVQVQAAQPGLGSISAYADPNNLIQESSKDNNGQTLAVTVR